MAIASDVLQGITEASSVVSILNLGTAQKPLSDVQSINGIPLEYLVTLDVQDADLRSGGIFPLYAVIPESYSISVGATYDTPLANYGIEDAVGSLASKYTTATPPAGSPSLSPAQQMRNNILNAFGGGTSKMMSILGASTKSKYQSVQIYKSGQPMSISLDLVFNATLNGNLDVRDKVKELMKLCIPKETIGGMMSLPGKNILGALEEGAGTDRLVSLRIGKFFYMKECLLKNVNADISSIYGESGVAHSITAQITVETVYATVTDKDLDAMFSPI